MGELSERFKTEKAVLEKIAMLEAKSTSGASTSATSASPSESSTSVTTSLYLYSIHHSCGYGQWSTL